MNQLFSKRPLLKTGVVGLLLLPLLIAINAFSPAQEKIPKGYTSSIIAFEFASNQEELKEVISPLSAEEIKDMDRLNFVDYGFMLLYGIFFFLFMSRFAVLRQSKLLKNGRWIIPFILICDAIENIQLLKLSNYSKFDSETIDKYISLLGIFTWLKWGLLATVLGLIGMSMWSMNKSKWFGYILIIPFVMGCIAFITENRRLEDSFGASIFLMVFLIFVYCYIYKSEEQKLVQ